MHRFAAQWLDRLIIRLATREALFREVPPRADEARALLAHASASRAPMPAKPVFSNAVDFQFPSSFAAAHSQNQVVHGKFFRAHHGEPILTLLLVHGWNDEFGYRFRFPWIVRQGQQLGISTAFIELPWHMHRRPRDPSIVCDFISADLHQMISAVKQSLVDIVATLEWLRSIGNGRVALCGFSLGAWLAGLAACETEVDSLALVTPLVALEEAIETLSFCAGAKRSLQRFPLPLESIDLVRKKPLARSILLVQGEHDQFVSATSTHRLHESWQGSELWTLPHGHISLLANLPAQKRILKWMVESRS